MHNVTSHDGRPCVKGSLKNILDRMWVGLQNRAKPRCSPVEQQPFGPGFLLPPGFVARSLRSMGYAPHSAPRQKAKALPARPRPILKIHPAGLKTEIKGGEVSHGGLKRAGWEKRKVEIRRERRKGSHGGTEDTGGGRGLKRGRRKNGLRPPAGSVGAGKCDGRRPPLHLSAG